MGPGAASPAEFFLAKAQVVLTDGAACGDIGAGHVRLNFATPRPILTEIVRRLAAAAAACRLTTVRPLSPSSSDRRGTRG